MPNVCAGTHWQVHWFTESVYSEISNQTPDFLIMKVLMPHRILCSDKHKCLHFDNITQVSSFWWSQWQPFLLMKTLLKCAHSEITVQANSRFLHNGSVDITQVPSFWSEWSTSSSSFHDGSVNVSGNGQAWCSPSPRQQWRTEKNGVNWLWSHLWCTNDPPGLGIGKSEGADTSFIITQFHSEVSCQPVTDSLAMEEQISHRCLHSEVCW